MPSAGLMGLSLWASSVEEAMDLHLMSTFVPAYVGGCAAEPEHPQREADLGS